MSSVTFYNEKREMLHNDFKAIMHCNSGKKYRWVGLTMRLNDGALFSDIHTDWQKRASLCEQTIQKWQQVIEDSELLKELNDAEQKEELIKFKYNISKLLVYFKKEQLFSNRRAIINTFMSPIDKLACSIAMLSCFTLATNALTGCLGLELDSVTRIVSLVEMMLGISFLMNLGLLWFTRGHFLRVTQKANNYINSIVEKKINIAAYEGNGNIFPISGTAFCFGDSGYFKSREFKLFAKKENCFC